MDQRALTAQNIEHLGILLGIELIGILDAQVGAGGLQEQRRISDVDRTIVSLYATFVRFAIIEVLLFEHERPGCWRALENLRVVHQHIGAPFIWNSIYLAIDDVPWLARKAGVQFGKGRYFGDINGLHTFSRNQTQ